MSPPMLCVVLPVTLEHVREHYNTNAENKMVTLRIVNQRDKVRRSPSNTRLPIQARYNMRRSLFLYDEITRRVGSTTTYVAALYDLAL